MKRTLIIIIVGLWATRSFAALNMRPGLWEIVTKIQHNGKEIDPQAEIKKALEKMPENQRQQMEKMITDLSKGNYNLKKGIIQVCYTKEMLEDEENLAKHGDKKCQTTVKEKSSSHIVTTFKCDDGESGEANFTIKTPTTYTGIVKINNLKGKDGEINYSGTFTSKNCGKVKPIIKK